MRHTRSLLPGLFTCTLFLAGACPLPPAAADETASGAAGATATGQTVLVELYTSQGCYSCPPADAYLADLAKREDVTALSLHVDYWDYLGWTDSFGRPAHTDRQYAYRDALGTRSVYTPQMVIQGVHDAVGSRPADVTRAIDASMKTLDAVRIRITRDKGMLKATLSPAAEATPGIVWVARYSVAETVEIPRGENAGKTLTYHNVVDSLEQIAVWQGRGAETVMLPQPGSGEGVAVWVQAGGVGPVFAAAHYEPGGGD